MWTDEQIQQHANQVRPSLADKMSDDIDWAMTLADDPDYIELFRDGE